MRNPRRHPGLLLRSHLRAFTERPGADCAGFLRRLALELGFKGPLPSPKPAGSLRASVAIFGVNQSRLPDSPEAAGGFSSNPPGNWMAAKLFLADGEGEVFLNFNTVDRVGEFSVKDEGYATIVVTELAKILNP